MSAAKRKRMLYGFGGLAVVLIAVIAMVSPNFRSEDARGAIGAVQKHREPQIAQSDVVLGDEQTKQDHQILYGDFLKDAAALQNIAGDLASESQSVEMRAQLGARQLDARYADLRARYQEYGKSALEAMQRLSAESVLAGQASFQDLSAQFSEQLQAAHMEELSAQLAAMAGQLGVAQNLAAVESQLSSFALAAREQDVLASAPEGETLRNAIEADNLGLRLRAQLAALDAIAKQAMTLEVADRALEAKSVNARDLGRMSADFLKQAERLEAHAVQNMEANMAANAATVDALGRMRQTLDAANQSIDARSSRLDARSYQEARDNLAAFNTELRARDADFQARTGVAIQAQLAAVNSHIEARSQAGNRSKLASAMPDTQNFAALARDLKVRAEVASRQR